MYHHSKRRKYFIGESSKSGQYLEAGSKGFLCTFNNRERDCIRESYNILNKYADLQYGAEKVETTSRLEEVPEEATAECSIEDELKKELTELKAEKANIKKRRFQVVKSGAKNVLFIQTTIEDPVAFASKIANDIKDTKQAQTRYLIRLIPIEVTCKAYVDDIKKSCTPLLEKHFKDNNKSFSIVYNRRNNSNLDKDEIIAAVANLVLELPGEHTVNLSHADVTIIIEIIKGIALIAVVPNYLIMKKFNLHAFTSNKSNDTDSVIVEDTNNEVIEDANNEAVKNINNEDNAVVEDSAKTIEGTNNVEVAEGTAVTDQLGVVQECKEKGLGENK